MVEGAADTWSFEYSIYIYTRPESAAFSEDCSVLLQFLSFFRSTLVSKEPDSMLSHMFSDRGWW